jgi:flagellar biosynthetic protein FliR
MPASLTLSLGTLYAFLLVLARVGGAVAFVPLPGASSAPQAARITLALSFTLALVGRWPVIDALIVSPARLLAWGAAEAALGIAIGVAMSLVLEVFMVAAQILGLQAGYAYASTIDPNSEADSGILLVLAQLAAGLLFFAAGLDREVLRLFAQSLEKIPPGAYVLGPSSAFGLIHLGASVFSIGLRLAFPVVAVLVMVDVALALLGRVNAQLQLLSLAFPLKMLVALMVLSWVTVLFPRILREMSGLAWIATRHAVGL